MLKNRLVWEMKMKKLRSLLILSLTIAGFLLAGTAAKADTILTLDPASVYQYQAGPGGVFIFDAAVTNNQPFVVFLNGDSPTVDAGLTLDDSPFFNTWPLFLAPGDTYTGELFSVTAPAWGLGSNFYTGSFTLQGGIDGNASDNLATVTFDIQVTPEPSTFLLFGGGVLTFGILTGRKLMA